MRSEAFDRTELPHLRTSAVLRDGDPRMPRFPDAFAAMADRERRHTRTHARTPLLAGFSCFPALCLKQRKESARRAGRLRGFDSRGRRGELGPAPQTARPPAESGVAAPAGAACPTVSGVCAIRMSRTVRDTDP